MTKKQFYIFSSVIFSLFFVFLIPSSTEAGSSGGWITGNNGNYGYPNGSCSESTEFGGCPGVRFDAGVTLDDGWTGFIWTEHGTTPDEAWSSFTYWSSISHAEGRLTGSLVTHSPDWSGRIDYGPAFIWIINTCAVRWDNYSPTTGPSPGIYLISAQWLVNNGFAGQPWSITTHSVPAGLGGTGGYANLDFPSGYYCSPAFCGVVSGACRVWQDYYAVGPDLTADSPTPTIATVGVARTFTATIRNIGTASTVNGFNNFFQIATVADGMGTVSPLSVNSRAALGIGASGLVTSSSYTFPSAGIYSVRVCADNNASFVGAIVESDETNNCSSPWTNITVSPAPAPDLSAGVPNLNTATVGVAQTFTATIINLGTAPTGANFYNSLQVSTCGGGLCPVFPLIASTPSPMSALDIGASLPASASYTFTGAPGIRSVRFCADNNTAMLGTINNELDENNNCSPSWRNVNVTTIPTVTSPTATAITLNSATLGANITLDGGMAITARGTCWGSVPNPSTNCVAEGGTAVGIFTHNRTGLLANTLYYYRGYATNSVGTGYSVGSSFTTTAIATADIKANGSDGPITIPYNSTADITWQSWNATSCRVDPPNWTELNAGAGTHVLNLTSPVTTYRIYCDPPVGGSQDDEVVVNVLPQPKNLIVVKAGQGTVTGTSNPVQTNVNCGPTCQAEYESGTLIVLTEVPNTGRLFIGWSGVACSEGNQRSPTCTFTLTSDLTITASFAADPNYREF